MSHIISPNTTIAQYTIVSKIGEGGMGEVWRARDTKLGRDVAIKFLPVALSENEDRLRRFEQEAQAAGALNHPNILVIHHIGTHEGAPYIVSELLEGETLRERIGGSALPQRKALDYALQIARGLAAAHEKGIVHRDLKPDNVFITNDGRVKILDFGLAKLTGPPDGAESQTEVPTRKVNTDPGTVMGTVGYMSPEQLKGLRVDHRSDIFSFGAVLYEMLSGKRAFGGDSMAETMSAILREDPPDLSVTNKTISPALERVVHHCLEKNPAERFHSASDLGFALESLSGISGPTQPEMAVVSAPVKRRLWPIFLGLSLALLALGTVAGILIYRQLWKTSPPSYRQLTFRRGTIWNARFAPDGHTIVYSATFNGNPIDLFSLRTDSPESRPFGLTNTDVLAVSPSGEMAVLLNRHHLGWYLSRGTLARMPLLGGAPREILDDVQEADWSPDGTNLAVGRYVKGKNQIEYPIGKVLYETNGWISHLRISPQGDRVAFMDHQVQWDNRGWVTVVDRAGKKTVLSGEWSGEEGLAWSPAGDEVWFTAVKGGGAYGLFAVTLSAQERLVARVPVDLMLHDISRDGRLLLTRFNDSDVIIGLPPGETKERDLSWLDQGEVYYLSSDGRTFLFTYEGEGGGINYSAYLRKTDGSPAVRLGEGVPCGLSPDGKWALSTLFTPPQIMLLPTGAGEAKRLERGAIEQYAYATAGWFPDGKRVAFQAREPGHGWRYYIQDLEGGNPHPFTPEGITTGVSNAMLISPDGKFVVAVDAEQKAFLYPVEGSLGPRPILGLDPEDVAIRWSADGRSLIVFRTEEMPIKVYRLDPSTGHKELLREITPANPAGIFWPNTISVTPDGKWYVYKLDRVLSDLYLVEGLK
jgi:eukaryotic-like serine/threonine-protein kinase